MSGRQEDNLPAKGRFGDILVQMRKCRHMRKEALRALEGCPVIKIASIWLLGPEDAPTIPFVVKVSLFFC